MISEIENPWKLFAREISAEYRLSEEGTSEVIGTYKEFPFILKIVFIEAAPKINIFLSHFEIKLQNKRALKFKIYREGIIQKLTKLFGTQDIIFNEKYFDKKYIVEGSDEPLVKKIITNDIRQKIIEFGEIFMILDGNSLIFEQSGKIVETKRLYLILDMLIDLAQRVQNKS